MADRPPPDLNRGAGRKRDKTSGKVADFRYKRPSQPDSRDQAAPARRRDASGQPPAPHHHSQPHRRPSPHSGHGNARDAVSAARNRRQAYAALDLGTNNCRLLIARPSGENFTVIDAFSRVVRLGEDLAASGRLSDAAMDRALAALHICAEKLRRRNVHLARSVATEACRRASNGADFIARVREETGIVLDIISAQEEARLAVLGCHILLESGVGPAVIFDIGGGSTELVLIEPGGPVPRILDWMSVPWGVVSLTDSVPAPDGTQAGRDRRYAEMRRLVDESFRPFAERVRPVAEESDVIRLLGTSGTVTTLASLHLELPQYDRQAVDGLIVPSPSMRGICTRLATMSEAERRKVPCIGDDRANMVVAGCAILESILDLWPAPQLGVADRGIREGILRSLIAADVQGEEGRAVIAQQRASDV